MLSLKRKAEKNKQTNKQESPNRLLIFISADDLYIPQKRDVENTHTHTHLLTSEQFKD